MYLGWWGCGQCCQEIAYPRQVAVLDIVGRRKKGRNQAYRASFQERGVNIAAGGHANVQFDSPAVSQDGDGSRDLRRDAQAEGYVILRADGDNPQGGRYASQGSGHGRNGTVTAAYHEHMNSLREGIHDHLRQVTARLDQKSFWDELPDLHLTDHIHKLDSRLIGCPRTGIEDQLGSHGAFILTTRLRIHIITLAYSY